MQAHHNPAPAGGRSRVHARFRHLRTTGLRTILVLSAFAVTANALAGDHVKADASASTTLGKFRHWLEVGQASWYSNKFQGRRTAAGEHYDKNSLTCAHRTLPLGSWLRVTNLRNRKSVLVRVNDRGPMVDNRIVDLSYAAAHAVGLDGVGKVKLEAVAPNDPEMARALYAQLHLPQNPLPLR